MSAGQGTTAAGGNTVELAACDVFMEALETAELWRFFL